MKKITLFLALIACSFGFSQTFTDNGGPYDMQNGNGNDDPTCGTADALTLPLDVAGIGVLGTVNVLESVTFNATHTWNSDITVELQDPSGGITVLLIEGIGGSGDGFVDCILQDDAGTPLPIAATTPVTGTFDPLNSLSTFTGADADGTWNLLVCDDAGGDVGTVDSWSLTFAPVPRETFTDNGGPYDMQNGNGNDDPTCGTPDALTLPLDVAGVGVLGTSFVLESVTFNATHTWNSDITVELQDPSGGTTVLLIEGIGGSGDGFVDCILQDGVGTPLPTAATTPVTGTFEPLNPLSAFTGADADGTWNLLVCDDAGGDVGTVDSWSLTFVQAPLCVPALFTLEQGTNNCPADEFFINVDITALGTASSVNILNDGGAAAINGVDTSGSPYSVGPFPAGTDVIITVEDAADVACFDTDSLTTLGSCPPDCATAPITPLDGATGLSAVADINFSWTAPASGPTPDSYDFYIGFLPDGSDQNFFANVPDTFFDVAFGNYDLTVYWSIVPLVGDVPAAGPCAIWSATSEPAPGDACLTAPFDQWPTAVYDVAASATCDGTTVNNIVTNAWTGEYSMVAVVAGENYRFQSSVPTDFVTIGSEDGTTAYIGSSGYVIWTSTITGNVRFYLHNSNDCSVEQVNRTRSIICGATLSTDDFDTNGELFSYYPNPVTNSLTLNAQRDIQNVVVYNMLGQQVMRTAPNAVNSEVDMSALNTGAYFVQVTIDNTTETIRIIKN